MLDGPTILNFSISRIPPAITALLEQTGLTQNEIGRFYLHQANRMINETIRKKLKLDENRFPSTLRDFGNTSSASVPLTITVDAAAHPDWAEKKSFLCGFGVGLSWASCIADMRDTHISKLIEV